MTNTAANLIETIRKAFDSTTEIGMEVACAIHAGEQNAADTMGWSEQGTEAFAKLTIKSIESVLEDKSSEVQSAFKKFGISY